MNFSDKKTGLASEKWQSVFDGLQEFVCLLDTDYRIISINRSTEQFLHKQSKEVIGFHCWEIFHSDKHPQIKCPACKMLPIHQRVEMEFPEGEYWFNVTLDPIYDNSGIQTAILHTIRNITGRKNSEAVLRNKEEALNSALLSKDTLFSIIAHDLRSPYQVLLNLSKILVQERDELTKEEVEKFSGMLYSEIQLTYEFLEDLLLWGNYQKGAVQLDPKPNDIKESILQAKTFLSKSAELKHITVDCSATESIIAEYDLHMISCVIRNLLNNAIKFTNRSGKVSISTQQHENRLIIVISDTGNGIPQEILYQIEKGTQVASQKGTEQEKGSGLGLVLVFEFIRLHGGSIHIRSEKNVGSSFYISLPLMQM